MSSWWDSTIWVAPADRRVSAGVRVARAMTRMLALRAACTPETESSTTMQSLGLCPIDSAAWRKRAGSGFHLLIW